MIMMDTAGYDVLSSAGLVLIIKLTLCDLNHCL